jgi:hypothetical protein
MKQRTPVSNVKLREAVLRWTKANLRWTEFVLAEVGSDAYLRIIGQLARRKNAKNSSIVNLLRLGTRLLAESGRKKR